MEYRVDNDFYGWEICTEKVCERIIDNSRFEEPISSFDDLYERIKAEVEYLIDSDYDGEFMHDLRNEFFDIKSNKKRITALIDNVYNHFNEEKY